MEAINTVKIDMLLKDSYPFKRVFNVQNILNVLNSRLPFSANMYNMTLMLNKDSDVHHTLFFTLQPKNSVDFDSVLIVAVYYRYDLGYRYSVSTPPELVITTEIKEAFKNSSVFQWDQPYSFVSLERHLTHLIVEMSAFHHGTKITIIPTYIYTCGPSGAPEQEKDMSGIEKGLTIRRLEPYKGAKFLSENWKYSTLLTFDAIEKLLTERDSIGVYVKGELVSGAIINDSGLMGLLHTAKQHRGRGYACLVMKNLMKEIVWKGGIPCSCIEIKNFPSLSFHDKLGMKFAFVADYIDYAIPRYETQIK